MSGWRQVAGGLAITFVVIVIVGASLSTAIAEQRLLIEPLPPTRTAIPDLPIPSATPEPTAAPGTADPLPSATPSPSVLPPTTCLPPSTWLAYEVQEGDTLEDLAAAAGTSVSAVAEANCLAVTALVPGSILYLPALPPTATATPTATQTTGSPPSSTPIPCGPPSHWVQYTVQSGDTLFSLAQATNTTVAALQAANCLGSSTYIQAGAKLWLPFFPPQTPTPTPSRTPTPSPTAGATTPPTPSPTPTPTFTPSPTATTTPSPTQTPSPTPTVTETRQPPTETGTATSAPSSLD